ncbi:MAG: hypothetical protein WA209_04150 [Candidatus Acidiferrales bacterium]
MMDYTQLYSTTEALHKRHAGKARDYAVPINLVHLINPVNAPAGHDLARAQAFTYESMRRAAAFAKEMDPSIRIDFVAAPLPEDVAAIPEGAIPLPELTRVSSEIGRFEVVRRLPLLMDIIKRGREYVSSIEASPAPRLIFTNVDIGVLPHFYCYAAWLIRCGHDVAIINRRSVADCYGGPQDLPAILSDFGHKHPGLDCFIFDSGIVDHFVPFNSIIGMAHVMRPLFFNLMAFACNPVVLTDAHATFHIGFDSEWLSGKYADYDRFNRGECLKVIEALCAHDKSIEARLAAFVNSTDEHKWIPEGVLGVRKRRLVVPPLITRIRLRLIRLLELKTHR